MTATAVCFVGLPGAGKTTFLAAFWAACRAGEANAAYTITKFPHPAARKYLQKIAEAWFEARAVERNTSASWEPIELSLRSGSGSEFDLRVPDLSGEAFRDAAAERYVDQRVVDLVVDSDLILFFVNAATATVPLSLADIAPAATDDAAPDVAVEFDPRALETDVLNAELLQMLPTLTETPERPPPLAVIVSAWDRVDVLGQSPEQWLDTNQPMFAQLLHEYRRRAPTSVVGISAQGGDYGTEPSVAQKKPSERPLVVTGTQRSHDIAMPLLWFAQLGG